MEKKEVIFGVLRAISEDKGSLISIFLDFFKEEYDVDEQSMIKLIQEKSSEFVIPLSIFKHKLSPAEAVIKYLKENLSLKFIEIGNLLNRDNRTIWKIYDNALKKSKNKIIEEENKYFIPIKIFANREYSILENITYYCVQTLNLKITELAKIINKNPSSLWTTYKRRLAKDVKRNR